MSSLEATEAECAAGRTAPRVSLKDIEAAILMRHDLNAKEIVERCDTIYPEEKQALSLLSITILVLKNGFTVIGKSAPASPENFDVELGRKLAYEDAVRQIWPLMGFALRDKLHERAQFGASL
jgi:hypothetical protein